VPGPVVRRGCRCTRAGGRDSSMPSVGPLSHTLPRWPCRATTADWPFAGVSENILIYCKIDCNKMKWNEYKTWYIYLGTRFGVFGCAVFEAREGLVVERHHEPRPRRTHEARKVFAALDPSQLLQPRVPALGHVLVGRCMSVRVVACGEARKECGWGLGGTQSPPREAVPRTRLAPTVR
jgi:hypothetical protein